jgi:hypothetical protein
MDQGLMILLAFIAILVIYFIYKKYKDYSQTINGIETKLVEGKKDAQKAIVIPRNTLPNVRIGKEMTIHFWLYIRDWNYNFTKPKHIIHFGDKDGNSMSPGVWLQPRDNGLIVRFDEPTRQKGISMNPLTNPAMIGEKKECDIVNIPLQRWNHIAIVLVNKTLDVYLNGKLSRSCTTDNIPLENSGDVFINNFGGYDGDIANVMFLNKAMSSSDIYANYYKGFNDMNLWKQFKSLLPSIKVSISTE